MFDLTAGTIERPFRDKHASATVMSVATHVAIDRRRRLGRAVFRQRHAARSTLDDGIRRCGASPRPAATPAARPPRGESRSVSKPVPTTGPTFIAPTEIPVGIQPESGIDLGGEGGVEGGVEGGIPGGVLGGYSVAIVDEHRLHRPRRR